MKAIIALGLLGLASAQSSVVSLFIPETGPQSLVASVIGNDATATTYSINCPPSEDECGMGPGMTYTGASETAVWTMKLPGEFTGIVDCSVGATIAVCTELMGGPGANFPGVSTVSVPERALTYMPVTITAGQISSVSGAPTTTTPATPGASTTAAGATASITDAASTTGKTPASGETGAASQTGSGSGTSTAASTGGLPAVTGNMGFVGGVAVAVAAAVL